MGTPALSQDHPIVWEPQPGPQWALITCPVFEVFFGGARGGGKTDGMLGEFASHADLYGENAIGLMVRRERTQLVETIERSRQIYGRIGARYNEQEKMWRFPNGARLRFAYLERDQDAEAYQGHSYTRVYVEEIGNFPNPAPVLKLMATLRSGAGVPCGFRATGNPGGPGQHWVKARYIDPNPTGWVVQRHPFKNPWTGESVVRERVYIPSRVTDNHFLGADYVANLQMQGSPELVRAWLEGDWTVIAGAFFPEFTLEKHVLKPFTIPKEWTRFRCCDWGSAKPFAVYWVAVSNGEIASIPRGALIVYREWYGCSEPNVGLKLTAEQVAKGIAERTPKDEKISYGVIDPSAHAQNGGPSIAERMSNEGVIFGPGDNKRVSGMGALGGWDQVRARLVGEDDRPMLYVFSTCPHLIRTLPALQHDVDRPEDVDTEGEDHGPDAIRYGCMSRPYIRKTPKLEEPKYAAKALGGMIQVKLPGLKELNRRARSRED